jgi:hypothetical protein
VVTLGYFPQGRAGLFADNDDFFERFLLTHYDERQQHEHAAKDYFY